MHLFLVVHLPFEHHIVGVDSASSQSSIHLHGRHIGFVCEYERTPTSSLLPDGRVGALFQGEPASILSVLTQLEGNPGMIRVDELAREEIDHEPCGDFTVLR